jgi:hypothetical protein
MFKRFILGFVVGLALMHYYLNYGEEVVEDTANWGEGAASKYRGDTHHKLADELLKDKGL